MQEESPRGQTATDEMRVEEKKEVMEELNANKEERIESISDAVDKLDRRMARMELIMEELLTRRKLGDIEFALRLAYYASQGAKTEVEAKENIAKLFNVVDDVYGRLLNIMQRHSPQITAQPQARQESEGVPSESGDVIARLARRLDDIEVDMRLIQSTLRDFTESLNWYPFMEATSIVREVGEVVRNEAELKEKAEAIIKYATEIYDRLREVYLNAIKTNKELDKR